MKGFIYKEATDKMDLQQEESLISIKFLMLTKESINNQIDANGRTMLHFVCAKGAIEFIDFLIKMGADPFIKDGYGLLPIHYAAMYDRKQIVELLITKNDFLKDALTNNNDSLVHIAVAKSFVDLTKFLILSGADLNVINDQGFSPLHFAALTTQSLLTSILFEEKGDQVKHANNYNYSALHIGASIGDIENSKALIQYKADINLKENTLKWSPLDFSKLAKNKEMVEFLLKNGAKDDGTVLKVNEISNFVKIIKLTLCHEKGALELANEYVPTILDMGVGIAVFRGLVNQNAAGPLLMNGAAYGVKRVLELTHEVMKNLSICKDGVEATLEAKDVNSLTKSEQYINYNHDHYIALEKCRENDNSINEFKELELEWILCKATGLQSDSSNEL